MTTSYQTCTSCGKSKPTTDYYSQAGGTRIRRDCKACFRNKQNARYEGVTTTKIEGLVGRVKYCRACDTDKDLSLFHMSKYSRDGRHSQCKVCRLERAEAKRREK